jgi:hypothetical protein
LSEARLSVSLVEWSRFPDLPVFTPRSRAGGGARRASVGPRLTGTPHKFIEWVVSWADGGHLDKFPPARAELEVRWAADLVTRLDTIPAARGRRQPRAT